ncbi:Uncharacterized protein TCM_024366 [Theobroma cacao]|uniref:Uncharacterized protein n=1 Tax=Theobroma cacao TaxID=3641 RepID=A0A061EVA2_THECC|nr:Uncharacterized protein TCM_024366 [Theobroma cacao]
MDWLDESNFKEFVKLFIYLVFYFMVKYLCMLLRWLGSERDVQLMSDKFLIQSKYLLIRSSEHILEFL